MLCLQQTDLHKPFRKRKATPASRRPMWLLMRGNVGEAVAANGEVRVGVTQRKCVATLTVEAKPSLWTHVPQSGACPPFWR